MTSSPPHSPNTVKERLEASLSSPRTPTSVEEIEKASKEAEKRRLAILEEKKASALRSEERRELASKKIKSHTLNKALILEDKLIKAEASRVAQIEKKSLSAAIIAQKAKATKEAAQRDQDVVSAMKKAALEEDLRLAEERRAAKLNERKSQAEVHLERVATLHESHTEKTEERAAEKRLELEQSMKCAEDRRNHQLEESVKKEAGKVEHAKKVSATVAEKERQKAEEKLVLLQEKLSQAAIRRDVAISSPKKRS